MSRNVKINDIRAAGYCVAGARLWFKGRGLDFRTLLDEGYPEEILLATQDPMAVKVVERKRLTDG